MGVVGKKIIERAIESDNLTEEQKKANHHARQNEMLTYFYDARKKYIEAAASGRYQEDINTQSPILQIFLIGLVDLVYSQKHLLIL